MPLATQEKTMSIKTHEAGITRSLTISFQDHRAHWRTCKGGWANIQFTAHKEGKWLSVNATEHADTGASKETFITLDAEQLQALRTLLQDLEPVLNWTAEVIAESNGKWTGNKLVFATKTEALDYAADLFGRWTSVRETRVVETIKPVNAAWIIGVGVKHLDGVQA
jgi:hypothetical protein